MNKGIDLGTYWLRVEYFDGRGHISKIETCARYARGSGDDHPLDADRIEPAYASEQELIDGLVYMFTEGNYSCDDNKRLFLARAAQLDDPDDLGAPCGDTIRLKRLTLIRPDGSKQVIYEQAT